MNKERTVVFISKPEQSSNVHTEDFRPISLTPFLLKTMERMVDRYIKDKVLKNRPLHVGQKAYTVERSIEFPLHMVVCRIEVQVETGSMGHSV